MEVVMEKVKLQEATDYKVMSIKECINALGWETEEDDEHVKVKCNCGNSDISYSGFFGTEVVRCKSCNKHITDLFSPIRTGNATCTVLDPNNFEVEKDSEGNDRFWIAEGIMIN